MPAHTVRFSKWKFIMAASLTGLGAAMTLPAYAQSGTQSSPVSTAPAYGGAATEGGPGSLNAATGERVPPAPAPLGSNTSGASSQDGQASAPAAAPANQQAAQQPPMSNMDRNLMRTLAEMHLAEIDLAKMAQSRSQDVTVRSFAQRMIDDHGKAMEQLQALADARGVILPGGPNKKHVAIKEKLTAMTGEEFTQNYLTHAGDNVHREAHQLLQQATQHVQDPALKEQVTKSIPVVEQHLQMAGHLVVKVRGRSAMQSSGATSPAQASQPDTVPASGSAPRQ